MSGKTTAKMESQHQEGFFIAAKYTYKRTEGSSRGEIPGGELLQRPRPDAGRRAADEWGGGGRG